VDAAVKRGIAVTPASAFWARPTAAPNAVRVALASVGRRRELERALQQLALAAAGSSE